MKAAWRADRSQRFLITHRDRFACRYCSAMPGSDLLEVDHLVPRAKGGTDFTENLVTACKACNGRKSDSIVFPHDLIERQEVDGWFVHKTFGEWRIVFTEDCIGVDNDFGYGFIDSRHWPSKYWWRDLYGKAWQPDRVDCLYQAAALLERLVNVHPFQ
jgi:hypothetical protein